MAEFKDILNFPAFHSNLVRYANSFDFGSVLRGAAQNETWRDTTSSTLWNVLGECGKDINNIVADAAINYVRNVSDINTCKVPALASIGGMLSSNLDSLSNLYKALPAKLQLLIDVFSVDREYLFGGDAPVLSIPLVRGLMSEMKSEIMSVLPDARRWKEQNALDDLFTEFSRNSHFVSAAKYRAFVKGVFKRFVVEVLTSTYSPSDETQIVDGLLWKELKQYLSYTVVPRETIVDDVIAYRSRHPLNMESTFGSNIPMADTTINTNYDSLAKQIDALQAGLNVSRSFDPWETADYVAEHGLSPTNSLTPNEKLLVEAILNAHNRERFDYSKGVYLVQEIDTRFSYYREQEFIKYIKAFLYLYETDVNSVTVDSTLLSSMVRVKGNSSGIGILDLYNYVDKKWIYDSDASVSVDEFGVQESKIGRIIGVEECDPHFIPRLDDSMINLHDGDAEWMMRASVNGELIDRTCRLDSTKGEGVIDTICEKLTSFVFNIHFVRNKLKRQAQFNAMRGTGALLSHAINDYLLTSYPTDMFSDSIIPRWSPKEAYSKALEEIGGDYSELAKKQAEIDEFVKLFRSYTNVTIVEYMDTTEYFNVRPTSNPDEYDYSLSRRYWETQLKTITDRDEPQIGVFTANEVREFYRDALSMGSLHSTTEVKDDVEEFLISLYESGATDVSQDGSTLRHPINDISNPDEYFAYSDGRDRVKVQNNEPLAEKQDKQYRRYTANKTTGSSASDVFQTSSDIINAYNWKNVNYSSVMLHPFLYSFRLWNPLVNIIINAFSSYSSGNLEKSLSSKKTFDDLYGLSGESKNFWKYNIMDYSGYMVRYEYEKHSAVDCANEVSPLTGYDGIFYPSAIEDLVDAVEFSKTIPRKDAWVGDEGSSESEHYHFTPMIRLKGANPASVFLKAISRDLIPEAYKNMGSLDFDESGESWRESFEQAVASVYWQVEFWDPSKNVAKAPDVPDIRPYRTYYGRWYSHLGYSEERLRRIARQIWYWRERLLDVATHRYSVGNYNLDIGNNSFFLLDAFFDEDRPDADVPVSIRALDFNVAAANARVNETINVNSNTTAGYCSVQNQRPRELWVRWNAEPLAFPAFDAFWDSEELYERGTVYDKVQGADGTTAIDVSPLPEQGRREEFGQVKFKDSDTNDVFSDIIERFLSKYHVNDLRGSAINALPLFYRFQQSANYMVFSMWDRNEDLGGEFAFDRTHLCPVHVLCKEEQVYSLVDGSSQYVLKPFKDDLKKLDLLDAATVDGAPLLSAPYVVSATRGSIIIPGYKIETPVYFKGGEDQEVTDDPENEFVVSNQLLTVKLDELICQRVNGSNGESLVGHVSYVPKKLFLNSGNLFSNSILISKNTEVLFSCCEDEMFGNTTIALAFLGNLTDTFKESLSRNYCDGKTRYSFDSDPVGAIALLRKKYYKAHGAVDVDGVLGEKGSVNDKLHTDTRIYDAINAMWNSFDRNDKFLCVVEFNKALSEVVWNTSAPMDNTCFSSRLLNVVSDASYIPNFAYQSPMSFDAFPDISGVNKLWKSSYLALKDHWQTQLLGLENNHLLDFTKVAEDLIVHDETDDVDTFLNPGKVVEAIYRIWEQSDRDPNTGDLEIVHNPRLRLQRRESALDGVLSDEHTASWVETWKMNKEGLDEFLDRYLTVVRCDSNRDGLLLNEKNWVLPTTKIRDLISDIGAQDEDEFRKLPLDDYFTTALNEGGVSRRLGSHIIVGTQDPFIYERDPDFPTTLRSPAYLLQYGNGVAGARKALLRISVEKDNDSVENEYYSVSVEIKFVKEDEDVQSREDPALAAYMDRTMVIPAKSFMLLVSQDDAIHMADYHMLTHHDDIFYNIPPPDADEVLRADMEPVPGAGRVAANKPAKTFLDYLYVYEGSTAFKVTEQTDRFGTFDWEHPNTPLDVLLYNFRKNQVDLNCLIPWNTYVTQVESPNQIGIDGIGLNVSHTTDCRAHETTQSVFNLGNLIVDKNNPEASDSFAYVSESGEIDEDEALMEMIKAGYSIHTWENGVGSSGSAYEVFPVSVEELDEPLRIYAYYQRVEDSSRRGYHFDLFFNIQNLLKPPFEYVSSVTLQPAPLIPKGSYLHLKGDEESLRKGSFGDLVLYVQLKYMVNDITSAVKTVPLATYAIHNISDDKPKFFFKRLSKNSASTVNPASIELVFNDVTVDASKIGLNNWTLTQPLEVVQTVSVIYNNNTSNDANRLRNLSFTVTKSRIERKEETEPWLDLAAMKVLFGEQFDGKEYPLRFNENYVSASKRNLNAYPFFYTYQDSGYTHENMYLKWVFPEGVNIFDAYKKFGCLMKVGATEVSGKMKSGDTPEIRVIPGRIFVAGLASGKTRLGREHGLNLDKFGYILTNASSRILLSGGD